MFNQEQLAAIAAAMSVLQNSLQSNSPTSNHNHHNHINNNAASAAALQHHSLADQNLAAGLQSLVGLTSLSQMDGLSNNHHVAQDDALHNHHHLHHHHQQQQQQHHQQHHQQQQHHHQQQQHQHHHHHLNSQPFKSLAASAGLPDSNDIATEHNVTTAAGVDHPIRGLHSRHGELDFLSAAAAAAAAVTSRPSPLSSHLQATNKPQQQQPTLVNQYQSQLRQHQSQQEQPQHHHFQQSLPPQQQPKLQFAPTPPKQQQQQNLMHRYHSQFQPQDLNIDLTSSPPKPPHQQQALVNQYHSQYQPQALINNYQSQLQQSDINIASLTAPKQAQNPPKTEPTLNKPIKPVSYSAIVAKSAGQAIVNNSNSINNHVNNNTIINNNSNSNSNSSSINGQVHVQAMHIEPSNLNNHTNHVNITSNNNCTTNNNNNIGTINVNNHQSSKVNHVSSNNAPVHGIATNLLGFMGLYVGNLSPDLTKEQLEKIFSNYGEPVKVHRLVRSPVAFIKYENTESPRAAIDDLYGLLLPELTLNQDQPLKLHFDRNDAQLKANYRPTELAPDNDNGECYGWRTTVCRRGKSCPKKHIPINRGIDFQMWMIKSTSTTTA